VAMSCIDIAFGLPVNFLDTASAHCLEDRCVGVVSCVKTFRTPLTGQPIETIPKQLQPADELPKRYRNRTTSKKACVTASARVWYLEPKWLR